MSKTLVSITLRLAFLASCRFAKVYMLRYRKNNTPGFLAIQDLEEIEAATSKWYEKFKTIVMPCMKAGGNTIKLHKFLAHFTDNIRRLGHPYHYHANPYEGLHTLTKVIARCGNFRPDGEGQTILSMVKAHMRLEIAQSIDKSLGHETKTKAYKTAHARAQKLGMDVVIGKGTKLAWLNIGQGHAHLKVLPQLLPAYARKNGLSLDHSIMVHKGVMACAVLPWNDKQSVLQEVRAAADYYHKPWYDCIQYQYVRGQRASIRYGMVRSILTLQLIDESEPEETSNTYIAYKEKTQVMLVQRLQKRTTSATDVLPKFGNTPLKWHNWNHAHDPASYEPEYELIACKDMIRRIYVMTDFKYPHGAFFFENAFKWDRNVKDTRTLKDKEGDRYTNGFITNPNPRTAVTG